MVYNTQKPPYATSAIQLWGSEWQAHDKQIHEIVALNNIPVDKNTRWKTATQYLAAPTYTGMGKRTRL